MKSRDPERRSNRSSRAPQYEQAVLELPLPMAPRQSSPKTDADERDRGVCIIDVIG